MTQKTEDTRKEEGKQNWTMHPDYHNLPEVIKSVVGPKAYAWMDAGRRATLEEDFCNPEVEEDL